MFRTLGRLFGYIWPHRRRFYLSILFALLVAITWSATLALSFPIVKTLKNESLADYVEERICAAEADDRGATMGTRALRWVRDDVLPMLPDEPFQLLAVLLGALLLLTALKGIFRIAQEILVATFTEQAVMGIRRDGLRGALGQDYQTLSAGGTSHMMSRFTHDVAAVRETFKVFGEKLVREPLKAIGCLGCAFFVNWQLTLLTLVLLPLAVSVFHHLGRLLKRASQRMAEAMARVYQVFEEALDTIKVIVAFDNGRKHERLFREEQREYYREMMTISRISALTSPLTEIIGVLAVCALVLPGAYLVIRQVRFIWGIQLSPGVMDIEELALLYTLLVGTIDPARKLSDIYARVKQGAVSANRVLTLIDTVPTIADPTEPNVLPRHGESVVFRDIRFTYAPADPDAPPRPPALDGIDLEVRAGECLAIVGENGSGKSTLVNLLPRYFDPSSGEVLIDGVNVRDVPLADLRGQIGVVTQETLLFDTTIAENIRYGKADATYGEIVEAARHADMLEFVESLPEGFETVVGEMGDRLSGGQRQRLTLARAIVRDPAILLLDEATSAVDARSTHVLHSALERFVRGRTTFVVTHAITPSLLAFVTRIVVMDRGQIVATGDHPTLLASCPIYQRLFDGRSDRASA